MFSYHNSCSCFCMFWRTLDSLGERAKCHGLSVSILSMPTPCTTKFSWSTSNTNHWEKHKLRVEKNLTDLILACLGSQANGLCQNSYSGTISRLRPATAPVRSKSEAKTQHASNNPWFQRISRSHKPRLTQSQLPQSNPHRVRRTKASHRARRQRLSHLSLSKPLRV